MKVRETWADLAKGIAMLWVILWHLYGDSEILSSLHALFMPAFFIINGYFYKPKPIFELVYRPSDIK